MDLVQKGQFMTHMLWPVRAPCTFLSLTVAVPADDY